MEQRIPRHVAVIMDGNGRWAQQRGLPRLAGHEQGSRSINACVEACMDTGVEFLTLYAFSSENWKRPKPEIHGLMLLLEKFLNVKKKEMMDENVRLLAIGHIHELPAPCQRKLKEVIDATAGNTKLTIVLALSYSGRMEIIDAVRGIVRDAKEGKLDEKDIDVDFFSRRLYTRDIPDPDLLIRTSGEMRVSNFLLWQLSYTEIHITCKLWPDFGKAEFLEALADYSGRNRRYGAI